MNRVHSYVLNVGLEAEFFLKDRKGQILFPDNHGFEVDEFPLLGELRAKEGKTPGETLANFYSIFYDAKNKARQKDHQLVFDGFEAISSKQYNRAIERLGGVKELPTCENIYNIDINEFTDARTKAGRVVERYVSNGLHIHFSANAVLTEMENVYREHTFPMYLEGGHVSLGEKTFYEKTGEKLDEFTFSRLTMMGIEHIIKSFDEVLPTYSLRRKLRYRQPGFFERKSHGGFEYRSFPFTPKVLNALPEIVALAFCLLKEVTI